MTPDIPKRILQDAPVGVQTPVLSEPSAQATKVSAVTSKKVSRIIPPHVLPVSPGGLDRGSAGFDLCGDGTSGSDTHTLDPITKIDGTRGRLKLKNSPVANALACVCAGIDPRLWITLEDNACSARIGRCGQESVVVLEVHFFFQADLGEQGDGFLGAGPQDIFPIRRNGDSRQNTNDHHDYHHFDQRKPASSGVGLLFHDELSFFLWSLRPSCFLLHRLQYPTCSGDNARSEKISATIWRPPFAHHRLDATLRVRYPAPPKQDTPPTPL